MPLDQLAIYKAQERIPDSKQVVMQRYLKKPPIRTDPEICNPVTNAVFSCWYVFRMRNTSPILI